MKRMIVYKSCSYVIMALLCTACAAGSPEEDMEDRYGIDPVAGGLLSFNFSFGPDPWGDTGWRNVER